MPYADYTGDDRPGLAVDYGPAAVALPVSSGQALIVGGRVRLMGWALRETTGTAVASLDLYSGLDITNQLVATLNIAPFGSTREWFGPMGIQCEGLFQNITAGSITGVIWAVLL